MLTRKFFLLILTLCLWNAPRLEAAAGQVEIRQLDDRLRIEIGGQLFSEYFYKDVPRPYFYPILGPGNLAMSRDWPMKDTPGEEHDHKHHRSLWFAYGEINGIDFWSEDKQFGKTLHQKFLEIKSGPVGIIRSSNQWVSADGKVILTDDRTMRIHGESNPKVLDFSITLRASAGEVTFGDTKEGMMAIRLAESMRLTHGKKPGQGRIINSEGVRDGETWGKRADWVDYSGPVQGKTVGVALFDDPRNPRHATWWHVRDYGLFAANPFGVHDFEKKPAHAGDLKLPAGEALTFSYRFIFHEGDESQAGIASLYKKFAAGE